MPERPTPFGKYFLLERINVGGMAEVYKAKTVGVEGFEKVVAIKRILPSVAEDQEFIKMFVDEAKITSQLSHANLARTFDLGKIDDAYYIAMEYVRGRDLRAVFERIARRGERMPLPLCVYVLARVCDGLDYAHRKRDPGGHDLQIVHRDVSPQNIILSYEGEVKLIDFGIAKTANKITKTQAGILKGKFGYMSPEQVRGLPLDRRSDIFAAGVVLYELCTGERLFTGNSDFSVLQKVREAKVRPPSQIEPAIPERLEQVMLKALAREAQDRYQEAADFAADLTRFLRETQPRPVTREDLAAFMKASFPEDEAERSARKAPPQAETVKRAKPAPRAEIVVRSKPPLPGLDAPTRPVSMEELAKAEREYVKLQRQDTSPSATSPSLVLPDTAVKRVAEDPLSDEESTVSTVPRRARFVRAAQYAVIVAALGTAAWALLSPPRPRGSSVAASPVEQATATPSTSEQREVSAAIAGELSVLSSPSGAQVYLDGLRKGVTPVYLSDFDPARTHAVTVEKKCYRAWQVAIPGGTGLRELAATLVAAPGACPGHLEKADGMSPPKDLPDDARLTLGFLSLASRPTAHVVIDGVDIGQTTPLLSWPLRDGRHKIKLMGSSRSKELAVEIRAGRTRSEIVDLAAPKRSKR